jgi:hypothetical protein
MPKDKTGKKNGSRREILQAARVFEGTDKFSLLQCAIILSNPTVPIDIAEYAFYEVRKDEGGKDETD